MCKIRYLYPFTLMFCSSFVEQALSATQEQFLSELFALCARYEKSGVMAASQGRDRRFYIIKVELSQSDTQD